MPRSEKQTHRFTATLRGVDGSSVTYVLVPATVMRAFGGRIRVPVRVAVDGATHRTTICNMGLGPAIGVPAALRTAARIECGDRVTVVLEVDREERTVDVPPDLRKVLSAAQRRAFDAMSYSHRKEYVLWVEDAKRPETRARRIAQVRAKLEALINPTLPAR
jgi:hypothetical protein